MSIHAQAILRIMTDPDVRYLESGSCVVKFLGGATEGKDKDGNYIDNSIGVEAWDKNAEVIVNYAPKGSSINVIGIVRQEQWEDKDTGKKRSRHILKASRIELLPRQGDAPAAAAAPSPLAAQPAAGSPFGDAFNEEEIPF